MKISTQKGFTLIELLVVISIIGLLSSVVLAAVNTAREKGKVAAGRTFDEHTSQAFGADAVAVYDFNEGSNGVILTYPTDKSGNGLISSASFPNAGITCSGNAKIADGIKGKALDFSLDASGCQNASFPYTGFKSTTGSISFWIKLNSIALTSVSNIRAAGSAGGGWDTIDAAGKIVMFGIQSKRALTVGEWTQILVSWNGSVTNLYINGALDNTGSTPTAISSPSNSNLYLGASFGGNFRGFMDQFAIYTQSIQSAEQAAEIYAAELPAHTLADAN